MLAALLYPSVLKTEANLFKDDQWRSRADTEKTDMYKWEMSKGGPFSPDDNAWRVTSFQPMSSFWRQRVKLETGRTYLVGAWFRRDMARALIWCYARTKKDKPYDMRMYLFGGFNSCLTPYLRPEVKRKLGGSGDSWQLMYRPIEVKEDLAGPVEFKLGIFMSTGSVDIARPFLIDITGKNRIPLAVEHCGGKPISRIAVELVGLRDLVWQKSFDRPVQEYFEVVELSDALRGFKDANRVDGSMLSVTYADGMVENVYAPQEGAFMYR